MLTANRDVKTSLTKGKEYQVVKVNYTVVGDDGIEIGFSEDFFELPFSGKTEFAVASAPTVHVEDKDFPMALAPSTFTALENKPSSDWLVVAEGASFTEAPEKPMFMEAPTEEPEAVIEEVAEEEFVVDKVDFNDAYPDVGTKVVVIGFDVPEVRDWTEEEDEYDWDGFHWIDVSESTDEEIAEIIANEKGGAV